MTQPAEPEVRSPFPTGTTWETIWVDEEGNQLPGKEGAAGGEIIVTFPDGTVQHTLFETGR